MRKKTKADFILERELAKLGAAGGAIGSRSIFGAYGGSFGARMVAKFLHTVDYRHTATYEGSLEDASKGVKEAIAASEGYNKMIPPVPYATDALSALVGSGFQNMNPTVLYVTFERVDDTTNIHISGFAKEGLIKQHSAEKAVLRVLEGLDFDTV